MTIWCFSIFPAKCPKFPQKKHDFHEYNEIKGNFEQKGNLEKR
jgi:hypothetical protein